ncbi:uncharacterized protein LOC119340208 [Triticum dicoccoides]|uniref:uncharacterized protein LOC119340208 n=1 Tax=Triticum dicoccoides TaxID=85692 RepID=UPI001891BD07|nr:uncharacterized protein LOC119340208 [Triticum dicoccoides]
MASGSRSPPSVSSTFPRERPIVSGLGLSGSPGSARSSSAGVAPVGAGASTPDLAWRQKGPSRKAMWRRRKALRRQQEAGGGRRSSSPSSSSLRREIPQEMYGLCFRCFKEGHQRQDCTNDPVCIRCGLSGHVSSQCKRPRSPTPEDVLRRAVIAKVSGTVPAPPAAAPMGRTLQEPGQCAPRALALSVAPNFPPVMAGVASPAAQAGICVLQRSPGMDELERRLQLAVVMYVGGARPPVSCEDAAVAISRQLDTPRHRFSVHKYHPEDFLVVFASHELRNRALGAPVIEHDRFKLFVKPWLRQAQAKSRIMRTQVDIMIEGVPSHAWSRGTAAELLGDSCWIDSLAPEIASREDLSLFKLRAWCVDPDEVPVAKRLWVPEPPEQRPDPAARRPSFLQLLEYPTIIHIGRMRDFSAPDLWRRDGSSDDSGQSGLPDDSDDLGPGGDVQVLPWTRGVLDDRGAGRRSFGPAAGGGGGRSYRQALAGRVGPSDWRIPPMTAELSVKATVGAPQVPGSGRPGISNPRQCPVVPLANSLPTFGIPSLADQNNTEVGGAFDSVMSADPGVQVVEPALLVGG